MRTILLALCMLAAPLAAPAAAQAPAQAADFEADDATVRGAQLFASLTPRGPNGTGRVLYLGRDAKGETVLVGLSAGVPVEEVASRDDVVAVVWIRPDSKPGVDDGALAGRLGRSLFLFDGSRGGAMWEIGRRGGAMQYRKAGKGASEWRGWGAAH